MPPPLISGAPTNPVTPGDQYNLTCTWPRLVDSASLYWINTVTDEVLPSTPGEYDPDKLVSQLTATASQSGADLYDCVVGGVTTGKDNDTLLDRVTVPVARPVKPVPGKLMLFNCCRKLAIFSKQ